MKTLQHFLHIMDFIGNQTVQGPNESFSAASKGFGYEGVMPVLCTPLQVKGNCS